jgi:hypothetical protein
MSKPVSPAEVRRWRFYAESLIQQAIDILDLIDGDADLEDGTDDKPSLASPVGGENQIGWCAGADDDRESIERLVSLENHISTCG